MGILPKLLSSKSRAEIFRLLFDGREKQFHLREIERASGLALRTIQHELKTLIALDLVISEKDGNRLALYANRFHPIYPDICNIVQKTTGFIYQLREHLNTKSIICAFIFGSIAKQEERAHSDIDILVIGNIGLRKVSELIDPVFDSTGREINPIVYSPDEWRKKIRTGDHFVSSVVKEKKIFLIGDDDVLGRLA